MGNGGYDADHYTLDMRVKDGDMTVRSTMEAQATQDLSSLNLDFRGFDIDGVTVNGEKAAFTRKEAELTVTPEKPLSKDQKFEVAVDYHGSARPYNSPYAPVTLGWNEFDGGSYVVSEPDGAPAWFPVNDHPSDKASYTFHVTVDDPKVVVANGMLTGTRPAGEGQTTYTWEARDPMASYLATVHVGDYVRVEDQGPGGLPIRHYFPADMVAEGQRDFASTPEMLEFFSGLFGPYPFETYGAVVMDTRIGGAALETQTLPLFERDLVTGDGQAETVFVHELAHQWFGDSISLKDWKDVWLNEGFATYAQWLWDEKKDGRTALEASAERARHHLEEMEGQAIGKPENTGLFDHRVYLKGALTLHALRKEVGDESFFKTIRTYVDRHRGGSAGTEDFIHAAQEVSGKDLKPFFDSWLHTTELPDR